MQPIASPFRPYCFPAPRFDCFLPPPDLRGAVAFLWSFRVEAGDGAVDLVPPEVETDIICRQGKPGSSFIRGPQHRLSSIALDASSSFVGARLRPGAAQWLAGRSNCELVDQRVGIPSLNDAHSSLAALARLLAGTLPAAVPMGEVPQGAIALRLIERSKGGTPMREIARRLGWSDRHLRREIRAICGLSPKECALIYRFQRAMRLLTSPLPLAGIAVDCRYTDQAHMTRDFARLAGMTPMALRRRMSVSDKNDANDVARDR